MALYTVEHSTQVPAQSGPDPLLAACSATAHHSLSAQAAFTPEPSLVSYTTEMITTPVLPIAEPKLIGCLPDGINSMTDQFHKSRFLKKIF